MNNPEGNASSPEVSFSSPDISGDYRAMLADFGAEQSPTADAVESSTPQIVEAERPPKAESLEQRVERALEVCDFERTEQLERGLTEYYDTNARLAKGIELSLNQDPASLSEAERTLRIAELQPIVDKHLIPEEFYDDTLEAIVGYGNMPEPIARVVEPMIARVQQMRLEQPDDPDVKRAELMLLVQATRSLYNEASVGVTTVSESDRQVLTDLSAKVLQKVEDSGLFDNKGNITIRRSDTRGAGLRRFVRLDALRNPQQQITDAQELFWSDCMNAGQLLFHNTTRPLETRAEGKLMSRRMQQALKGHVNRVTAAEAMGAIHSPTIHWSRDYSPTEYRGARGGIVAVPIGEIVSAAPYARDAEYGVLTVKPSHIDEVQRKIVLKSGIGVIGAGGNDRQGYYGNDRTFYSTPVDVDPDAPLETAPDGYVVELSNRAYAVVNSEEDLGIAQMSGLGEGFPGVWMMPASGPSSESVLDLQRQSIARRPMQFVVPVRAGGVFDFYVHDDGKYDGRSQARFNSLP